MRTEEPKVALLADRFVGKGRDLVRIGETCRAQRQQPGKFLLGEAGQREIEAKVLQLPEFQRQ